MDETNIEKKKKNIFKTFDIIKKHLAFVVTKVWKKTMLNMKSNHFYQTLFISMLTGFKN